ncbi:hypothetical protein DS830_02990 [Bombilactobacillus bombi]|nr:hypothetical protein DS830_02990 [Bombilactobacillus bombi]
MTKNLRNICIITSWLALIIVIILYACQTRTVNINMWLFLIIIPTLIYLPLFFNTSNNSIKYFKRLMIVISYVIFLLAIVTMSLNASYPFLIRIIIIILSLLAIFCESIFWIKNNETI